MDESRGSLRALNICRSFFIGAVGVLGAVLIYPAILETLRREQSGAGSALLQASLLFGLAVTLGTVVYTIHRAIVYPFVLRWVLVVLCIFGWYPLHWSLLFEPLGCPIVREARRTLWLARHEKNNQPFIGPLNTWSDHVQFLYASGLLLTLLVWLGPWVVQVEGMPYASTGRNPFPVAVSAVALLAIAIVNDLRLSWMSSAVLPVPWQFTNRDRRWRVLLWLAYLAWFALGVLAFSWFAWWMVCSHHVSPG